MKLLFIFIFLIALFVVGCVNSQNSTEEDIVDSIVKKINDGKINELSEGERAYWNNVIDKTDRGEELNSNETRLNERLKELKKELDPRQFLPERDID